MENSVKINRTTSATTTPTVGGTAIRARRKANQSVPATVEDGGVEINPVAAQIQALEASLADVAVADTAKVNAVRQAISDSRFKVDA